MTPRRLTAAAAALAAAVLLLGAAGMAVSADESALTAGAATVHATGRNAFSFPAANLGDEERTRFVIGNSFFRRNWVEAPASTQARDGLGPHFIARSCGGCHVQDGRGAPPDFRQGLSTEQPVSLLIRLSVPGVGEHGAPHPHPVYGDQLNNAAIRGVKPEGQVRIRQTVVRGRFADGTPYELLKPHYRIDQLAYGPLGDDVMLSPRIAPQVIGMGLLEAIPEAEIRANAQQQAATPGPIKGRPNEVWDAFAQRTMLGRFGWKANVATVAHQTAGAFIGDMGITSTVFPTEACSTTQSDCSAAPHGGNGDGIEIDDETLAQVVFYTATLAPPARRQAADAQVLRGGRLFESLQCAACHRPSYTTGDAALAERFPRLSSPALKGLVIKPYTDLLLHDMGPELADGRPDYLASGSQWRTPPLWGIGLIQDVNGHMRLLHDGRARGVLEAVLWHGGEAQASRDGVLKLNKQDREALVKFVESL
ncbi:di-heme oxidoreductase family protein [Aquincola tertiaricarbonis]|uniref:di-heme oxidoreductase family protein n=1 Tax=Aquincola tertiaricarbonis TaxID=391953 RepID=UPI000614A945